MELETAEIFNIRPEFTRLKKILVEALKKREPIKMGESSFVVIGHDGETFALQAVKCASPAAWTGEGRPPVGTVCEFMKHNSPPAPEGQWTVGDIRYVSDCYVIIGGDGCEHAHHPRNCSFRPVRTPEQIAEEEREQDAQALFALINPGGKWHKLDEEGKARFRAAVAAGYRKQVAP